MTLMETLGMGGSVTLIGMGVVFTGLILLVFITKIMSAALKSAGAKEQLAGAGAAAAAATTASVGTPVSADGELSAVIASTIASTIAAEPKGELVAVIGTAVASAMGTEPKGIRIHSIHPAAIRIHSIKKL